MILFRVHPFYLAYDNGALDPHHCREHLDHAVSCARGRRHITGISHPVAVIRVKMKPPEKVIRRYAPTRRGLQRVARQLTIGERALIAMRASFANAPASALRCSEIAARVGVTSQQINAAFSGMNNRGKKPRAFVTDGRTAETMNSNWKLREWHLTLKGADRALTLTKELEAGVATL